MESVILVYEGYSLYEAPRGYISSIDGNTVKFDTASQWKEYIDYRKNGKSKKESNRR